MCASVAWCRCYVARSSSEWRAGSGQRLGRRSARLRRPPRAVANETLMDQFSPARLAEPSVAVPPSERFGSRLSGTRRISATGTAAHPASTPIEAAPGPTAELPTSPAAMARWRLDERLRRRWLDVSIGAAALAGGAGPLLASSAGGETRVTCLVMSLGLICLSQAALAWTAPHWQAEVRWHVLGSW